MKDKLIKQLKERCNSCGKVLEKDPMFYMAEKPLEGGDWIYKCDDCACQQNNFCADAIREDAEHSGEVNDKHLKIFVCIAIPVIIMLLFSL